MKLHWIPHFALTTSISFFLDQGVKAILHYTLLIDILGASLIQVTITSNNDSVSFCVRARV